MNAAQLAAAERMIIAEAMGPSMVDELMEPKPKPEPMSKWSTLKGKIEVLQKLGLAKKMSPEQKRWFMKNHDCFKFMIENGKCTFAVSGSRYRSLIFQAIFKRAKLWERPRVSSVAYRVTGTELTVTIYHK